MTATTRPRRAPRVLEADFQATVLAMAKRFGWRVAHFRSVHQADGRHLTAVAADGAGFPDLVLTGHGRVMFRELKRDGEYPSPEQRAWLSDLADGGADVKVWRPADWKEIEETLRAGGRARPPARTQLKGAGDGPQTVPAP